MEKLKIKEHQLTETSPVGKLNHTEMKQREMETCMLFMKTSNLPSSLSYNDNENLT